jgi:hypothetical protein
VPSVTPPAGPGTFDLHRPGRPSDLSAWCAGHFGQVDPGLDTELVEDMAQVSVYGMRRYEQRLRDFAVRFTFRCQVGDGCFRAGQGFPAEYSTLWNSVAPHNAQLPEATAHPRRVPAGAGL